jgi:glutamate synthase (NADPH/NADH) small chain
MAKQKRELDLNRHPMPKQDPSVRIQNFEEVATGYLSGIAVEEARRCLQSTKPHCVEGCPVMINIPGFIGAVAEGDLWRAIEILHEKNILPAICGRVCPQEEQCELSCALSKRHAPVCIGRLERFVADWAAEQEGVSPPQKGPSTGKRVAVVGSGPAGLTVAFDLLRMGHDVVIFEALHEPGGVLIYGIPEFRLPKAIVRREIEQIERMGATIVLDYIVGKTATVEELLDEFDAVFIGTGAGLPWFLGIPGEDLNGVYSANEYLTRVNLMRAYRFPECETPVLRARRVAVIGGGNVAMDAARTALRIGAEEVRIVYRRSRTELPARAEEVENAEEEGVIFEFLTAPLRYTGDASGRVREMECQRMELGEPDSSGRRRPIPLPNSEFRMPVDMVICAIGQSPNPMIPATTPGLTTGRQGTIVVDPETGQTSLPGVFAGGDVATGGATVILAMGAGRAAAKAIDEYLKRK